MMERSFSQDDNIIDSNINIMDFLNQDSDWEDLENHLSNAPIVKSHHPEYGFSISFPTDPPMTKGVGKKRKLYSKYVFDSNQNKLFVSQDCIWVLDYKVLKSPPKTKDTYFLRIYAEYLEVSQKEFVVERCPVHCSSSNLAERCIFTVHNLSADAYQLLYLDNKTYISVLVPFAYSREEQKVHCSVKCYNSCAGGIERRATIMFVSLEKRNLDDTFDVMAKQFVHIKCSASVARDAGTRRSKSSDVKEEAIVEESHEPYVKSKKEKFYLLAVNDLSTYHLLQATRDFIFQKTHNKKVRSCQHIETCVARRLKNESISDEEILRRHSNITPQSEWVVMSSQGSSQGSYYCPGPISLLKNEVEEITIKRNSPTTH